MVTYDVELAIGQTKSDERLIIKENDTGFNLCVKMYIPRKGTWDTIREPFVPPKGSTAVLKAVRADKKPIIQDGEIQAAKMFFEFKPETFTAIGKK